jgi:glycosyltransferase involved in cell wall biosynthesis
VSHAVDVSVIVPFSDDEETVGRLARRVTRHLESLHLEFEILFADEGSSDNSVALLAWLARYELPQLRLCSAEPGRGFAAASALARGRVLWFFDIQHAETPLSAFAWAYSRLVEEHADVVILSHRFTLARRTRAWNAVDGLRGRGVHFETRLRRRARFRGLHVESALGDWHTHLHPEVPAGKPSERAALWTRVRGLYTPSPATRRPSTRKRQS